MRLLIIEDDPALRESLSISLTNEGYAVEVAADGEEGLYMATEFPLDAAIIDLGLPKMDGLKVIKKLREQEVEYPIIILTARDQWQDKVEGLEAGADDYLAKPFHIEELKARLNALIRRAGGHASPQIEKGPILLDTSRQHVTVSGESIELTAYEYKVLEYLMMHPGKVVSKTELTEHIYQQDFDRDSNVIEVFVGRLRKKIDPNNEYQPIETLRGRGYRFTIE